MKFPIKLKIVALGVVLSTLVTSTAVLFAHFEYRRRQEEGVVNAINNWLDNLNTNIITTNSKDNYLETIKNCKSYLLERYEANPGEPPAESTIEDQKQFYSKIFNWFYPLEGLSMYLMTEEEKDFRDKYEDLALLISDAKYATSSSSVYISFMGEDKTMFYLADEYSYTKLLRPDMYLPGSRSHNFNYDIVKNGDFCDCAIDGTLNRVLPIYDNDEVLVYVFVEYDFVKVNEDVNSLITMEIIVLASASLIMIIAYVLGAHFLFLRNVEKLAKTTSKFTDGLKKNEVLETKDPNIKSHDEIAKLSESFISLEEGIIEYINVVQKDTQEKERSNAELSVASNIQLGALPNHEFDDKNASIRAFIKSAKEVGGDFYDYFYLDDHRLAIIISDVSGKGIPAALFMMKSKELIKSAVRSHKKLTDAIKEVNTMLSTNNNELLFVTSFIGIIDFEKGVINYVNAGHEKPYIVSSNGVRKLDGESNFVMGGEEDFIYKEESAPINKGEYIFLFTDGLNESINNKNEEFSYERIEKVLDKNKDSDLDDIIKTMNHELEIFVGEKEQFDDVTMVLVRLRDNELTLSYEEKDYNIITDIIDTFNKNFSFIDSEVRSKCGIIIDEFINNLISYEKREDLKISLNFKTTKDELILVIKSNGEDYNPFINHKEKYLEGFHPELEEGGFGLSIIKDLAESYSYKYLNKHSVITITLSLKPIDKN